MSLLKHSAIALVAAVSLHAVADDRAELREELKEAQAKVAEIKGKLAEIETTIENLPAGVFVPANLQKVNVDRDDGGEEIQIEGKLPNGNVKELAMQVQKALKDAGYSVVKESLDKDDDAKLVYEKKTGDIRETIEVDIEKSWLSDKIEYEVEYEKH
ncbi:hypothetical protein [Suttonella ornithocola]|uniref:PepSY domain-containing protein n=1 Tax=Suttonella ornithocola TaxID=279832 RepID=A0A380MP71_9GAMM|nr:hypothetical protein [Suttonella ornithocola]SUO93974.1 Uncharacterised protein [Suttonella ornithocola]